MFFVMIEAFLRNSLIGVELQVFWKILKMLEQKFSSKIVFKYMIKLFL